MHGHAILQEKQAAEIYDEVGQRRSLERLFPGFTEDRSEHGTLSAGHAGPAAKPRILAVRQDVIMAGLLPKQPLETRLAAVIETASTHLEALHDEDRATVKLCIQKAAQAADEGSKQLKDTTALCHKPESELEHTSSASQDHDDNLDAQLSRLSDRTLD